MLQKVSAILVTAALLTGTAAATAVFAQPASAQQFAIEVKLNGKNLQFPHDIVTENGVVYVNASALADALGGYAAWDTMTESVLISKENKYALRMYKNSTFAYRNGKEFRVPFPPRKAEGGVLVPLVFIAEELGADVTYDAASRTYHLSIPIHT